MFKVRNPSFWATAGVVVLGILALVLSVASIASGRPEVSAEPEEARTFDFGAVESGNEGSEASSSDDGASAGGESSNDEESGTDGSSDSEDPGYDATDRIDLETVVIGDSNSLGDPADIWLGAVAEELGWGPISNLSAPGRGYTVSPRSCDDSPCAPFAGTVDAVAELSPDIVVTFGGTADGDVPLTQVAGQYFDELRAALPDAEIIVISPIYSSDAVPNWAPLHAASIRAAVEAVGGTYIDVGQPALGDGDSMSPTAHAEVADLVISTLQE